MDLESPNFLTSLVAIGHIAQICPGEFASPVKGIVSKFIVKELLMQDRVCSFVYIYALIDHIFTVYNAGRITCEHV